MIDTFVPTDAHDPRIAARATGLLAAFNAAGAVTAADVHVATAVCGVAAERDERVALAVALASAAVRAGSVCVDLAATAADPVPRPESPGSGGAGSDGAGSDGAGSDGAGSDGAGSDGAGSDGAGSGGADPPPAWPEASGWVDAVAGSDVVALGLARFELGLLYLDRYHQQEVQVVDDLAARDTERPVVDEDVLGASVQRVLPGATYAEQARAVRAAVRRSTTVLTGGPGTGKTTTVAALLVTLQDQGRARDRPLRVALTAPTGKAAARLRESVAAGAATLDPDGLAGLADLGASTLHRLLRRVPGQQTRFRHHRGNRLPHDVVVVDEASMVSLTMMARLLEAVRPEARLVLVGDPDQLASVDAGAVLTDLVAGYEGRADSPVQRLDTVHRYGAEIGALAAALRGDDVEAVLDVLAAGHDAVRWVRDQDPALALRRPVTAAARAVHAAALAGRPEEAVAALDGHRLLCAHREGPAGVRRWNRQVEEWLADETGDRLLGEFYPGRPLLVTTNDYGLDVYNGDTGVVVAGPSGPRVALGTGEGVRDLAPSRLPGVQTMHAMTIHKSQGSQAAEVTVLLPDQDSRLLTRELLYTAVTRATTRVRIVGSEAAVRDAFAHRVRRASGLTRRLGRVAADGE